MLALSEPWRQFLQCSAPKSRHLLKLQSFGGFSNLFNAIDSPQPTKAWKSIIKCDASTGRFLDSLTSFKAMRGVGRIGDRNVFPSVLKSCVHLRSLKLGESVHGCVIRLGLVPVRDVVSWNTAIGGNVESKKYKEALDMIREMVNADLKPDSFTLSTILPVFKHVMKGKEIHCFVEDVFVGSSLIDMYTNCTRVEDSNVLIRWSAWLV